MNKWVRVLLVFGLMTGAFAAKANLSEINPLRPAPQLTPGELCSRTDTDFKEFRYKERVPYCERNVSNSLKGHIYNLYGVHPKETSDYTVDHLIPLALGGNNSRENLWPEHIEIKALRKNLEFDTYRRLDRGEITQNEAVQIVYQAKMNPPIDIKALQGVFYQREGDVSATH